MKVVWIIIFVLVLLFLQIGIFPHLKIVGAFPNLIILAILGLSVLQGWKKALPWIIAGGLFLDFYSLNNILGISVVSLFIATYLAYFLSQNLFKGANFWSLVLIFLITILIYQILLIILSAIFSITFDFKFLSFIVGIIYNLIFALPLFYLIRALIKKIPKSLILNLKDSGIGFTRR